MAQERVQKQKAAGRADNSHAEETNSDVTNAELAESTDAVLDSIDDVLEDQLDDELLADIDDILETDAEEFVNNYVQQGGQ